MEIISVVNRRGGVGKTATAHAIGGGLAAEGKKVLFIDLDSQCNLSYDLGIAAARTSSLEVLSGTATAEDSIHKITEKASAIPASPSLAGADLSLTGTGKEYKLREALEPIKEKYDYIIIDTPPALNVLTVNALTAATAVIIPAQAEVHSLQGIYLLEESLEAVKKYTNPALKVLGIVITRYNGRAILSRDMVDNMAEAAAQIGTSLFDTNIRECIAIKEAQATQTDIFTYSPKSNAAEDYKALIKEIKRRLK